MRFARHPGTLLRATGLVLLSFALSVAPTAPGRASPSPQPAPPTGLVAIVVPGESAARGYGVHLGYGLILTNWHPWTLDGVQYLDAAPTISPSRAVISYDADAKLDPGERTLDMALCSTGWADLDATGLPADCIPYFAGDAARFAFPGIGDDLNASPMRPAHLLYASRAHDLALFAVDPAEVTARGIPATGIDATPFSAGEMVQAVTPEGFHVATIRQSDVQTLPDDVGRFGGPWQVRSSVLRADAALPLGTPLLDTTSGAVRGLVWRASDAAPDTEYWITPASEWLHTLFAANDTLTHPDLARVLTNAAAPPVNGRPTLDDPLTPELGNSGIDIQHYDLALAFDLERATLTGTATLTIRATAHRLQSFTLDARDLSIAAITLDGTKLAFSIQEHKLRIHLPEPVDYGTVIALTIDYTANPQSIPTAYLPYYRIGMSIGPDWVFAFNQPDGARTWYPANDHPRDRATFEFFITVPQPLQAIANGQLMETTLHDDGTSTFHWQMAAPMATYLSTVAVGDYVAVKDQTTDGVILRHYVYADQRAAGVEVFSHTDDALAMLQRYFGLYPYDSYGHVVTPIQGMALETQTMTIMPDSVLRVGEDEIYSLLVHELAHQWFGNTVTPSTWADIWLNEGFATFAEWLGAEVRYGESSALAARSFSEQALLSSSRSTPLVTPLPAEMLGLGSYDGGAWVLHMLRRELGDDVFFQVLRRYAVLFRERPADSLDFWRMAEEVSGRDLAWFFSQWLLQGGLPRYTLYWQPVDDGVSLLLCATTTNPYRLTFDLMLHSDTAMTHATLPLDGTQTSATIPTSFAPAEIVVDPDQHVLARVVPELVDALPATCPVPDEAAPPSTDDTPSENDSTPVSPLSDVLSDSIQK